MINLINDKDFRKPLELMIEMSKVLELMQIEDPKISIINCFPLRQSIIHKYIRIDTTKLIHLFYDELNKKLSKKRKELLDNAFLKEKNSLHIY